MSDDMQKGTVEGLLDRLDELCDTTGCLETACAYFCQMNAGDDAAKKALAEVRLHHRVLRDYYVRIAQRAADLLAMMEVGPVTPVEIAKREVSHVARAAALQWAIWAEYPLHYLSSAGFNGHYDLIRDEVTGTWTVRHTSLRSDGDKAPYNVTETVIANVDLEPALREADKHAGYTPAF